LACHGRPSWLTSAPRSFPCSSRAGRIKPYAITTYAIRQNLPADLKKQFQDFANRGVAETDPAKRGAIYSEFNKIYMDQAPIMILSVVYQRHYEPRWMQGFYDNPIIQGAPNIPYLYPIQKN
jgi:ABC-type transport system substrate-binding protein